MLQRFLRWYLETQASKMCLKKWDSVSAELTEAFYRVADFQPGYQSRIFAERMALRFFEIERRNTNPR